MRPSRYTVGDAFALLEVDPSTIDRSLLHAAPRRPQWGRVVGDHWHETAISIDEEPIVRGVKAHFERDVPWEETALVDGFLAQLDRFGVAWGYTRFSGFQERTSEIESLYERLQQTGYRRQDRLHERPWTTLSRLDEINVDIGPHGTCYWRCCGQHRLALAQVLGIEHVPVVVQRRHRDWERRRRRVARTGLSSVDPTYRSHPDLLSLSGGTSDG